MNGRTFVLILFSWSVLVIVTPMLVRMSESAKPTFNFDGEGVEVPLVGMQRLLPRRGLISSAPPEALALAPEPAPAPAPAPQQALR
ncbi:hypothetical protein NMG60_11016250 [Bertholletia excelsa]